MDTPTPPALESRCPPLWPPVSDRDFWTALCLVWVAGHAQAWVRRPFPRTEDPSLLWPSGLRQSWGPAECQSPFRLSCLCPGTALLPRSSCCRGCRHPSGAARACDEGSVPLLLIVWPWAHSCSSFGFSSVKRRQRCDLDPPPPPQPPRSFTVEGKGGAAVEGVRPCE